MARLQIFTIMFKSICKEEKEEDIQRDFATLEERLQGEKAMEVEVVNRPIKRSKQSIEVVLLPSIERSTRPLNKKARCLHKNWFAPNLWGPIEVAI